jgi:protein-S-isoprenylcysteine O-methyltransferase Ste14
MYMIQTTLRIIATVAGMVAILAPVANVVLKSGRERGRSVGSGLSLRRWPAVLLITTGFLAAGIILWEPLPFRLVAPLQFAITLVGFIIYIPTICLYLWGMVTLGRFFGVSTTKGADLYSGHQLVKKGPYRFIRHPMYLAVMLAAMGAFMVFLTWAMVIFLPMSSIVIRRASQEEELLAHEFGEEWQSYARQVPKWIPRIRKKSTNQRRKKKPAR